MPRHQLLRRAHSSASMARGNGAFEMGGGPPGVMRKPAQRRDRVDARHRGGRGEGSGGHLIERRGRCLACRLASSAALRSRPATSPSRAATAASFVASGSSAACAGPAATASREATPASPRIAPPQSLAACASSRSVCREARFRHLLDGLAEPARVVERMEGARRTRRAPGPNPAARSSTETRRPVSARRTPHGWSHRQASARTVPPPAASSRPDAAASPSVSSARSIVRRTASTATVGETSEAGSRYLAKGEARSGTIRSTRRVNRPHQRQENRDADHVVGSMVGRDERHTLDPARQSARSSARPAGTARSRSPPRSA